METLGDFIRRAVALRNTSLRQASKDMGFSPAYLERIVNKGIRRPGPERIRVIAKYFNADLDYLMQLAGYLTPRVSDDPLLSEIIQLCRLLSDEGKRHALYYVRALKIQEDVQALAKSPSTTPEMPSTDVP